MLERDFKPNGNMTSEIVRDLLGGTPETSGYLPFYSVDTEEEVWGLLEMAVDECEIEMAWYEGNIVYIEKTLEHDQTLDNLTLAGERLSDIHMRWKEKHADSN